MRQRLSRGRRVMRAKYPRTHKIIDKTAMILTWTPIVLIIYLQAGLLTYKYSKTDTTNS